MVCVALPGFDDVSGFASRGLFTTVNCFDATPLAFWIRHFVAPHRKTPEDPADGNVRD